MRPLSVEHEPLDRRRVRLAADHGGRLAERRVRVLEPVAGEDADDRLGRLAALRRREPVDGQARYGRGRGRRAEDALAGREPVTASIASSQRAGLPIRIAEAIVSGSATGSPCTSGAAPSAWKP